MSDFIDCPLGELEEDCCMLPIECGRGLKQRAPKTREPLDIAAELLRGRDGDGLREVADMLEDIAEGRWTLVDEAGRREAGLPEL